MSGFEGFPGADVRAKLDHPVIDADAHIVECDFAHLDFVRQLAGEDVVKTVIATRAHHGPTVRGFWWGLSSGAHTGDRALAQLPRYFRSRMDELGIDFAHFYTTRGLSHVYLQDEAARRASCRALNMLYAEMFADVGDRMRPVAVIPTYTPREAIEELEFAVTKLGHKAVMIGTELRGPGRQASGKDPFLSPTQSTRSIVMDSPHDYDPFWRKCIELKVTPVCHTSSRGIGDRASPSNYVFNHLGDFAAGAEFFCRSLLFSGVTKRFPELSFGFLEGGVGWAVNLLNDIVEHWEKRNVKAMAKNLDPALLDVDLLERLFREFGSPRLSPERIRANPHGNFMIERPDTFDEFAACALTELRQLRALFVDPFYFGCEADDRMVSVAFNRRLNPLGATLKPVFGSDIGHWDVLDAASILTEAWSLVRAKLLTEENFRDLTFVNPAMMHLSMNPDYFRGTVVEDAATALLQKTPRKAKVAGEAAE
ncbi:MAG TPA: amidohydrolase family protein [Alphaproteobacteria bacterium]|nr:amidohydrolase family protein [Alphaproteobacteria bacterium]